MLDSVTRNPLSTLLRAQNVGLTSNVGALKTNTQSTQAIIEQLQNGPSGSSKIPLEASSYDTTLPRGSLVNILV